MTPFSPARDALADLLRRRIVVAPMAGGSTTTELVVAAARAGALGWLASGYKTPEAMAAEIAAVRAATAEPFGVNLFVPGPPNARRVPGLARPRARRRQLGRRRVRRQGRGPAHRSARGHQLHLRLPAARSDPGAP